MKLVTTSPTHDRTPEAWACVVAGFDEALKVAGLSPEDRARFVRCRGHAAHEAGVTRLAAADATRTA